MDIMYVVIVGTSDIIFLIVLLFLRKRVSLNLQVINAEPGERLFKDEEESLELKAVLLNYFIACSFIFLIVVLFKEIFLPLL